MLDDQLRENFLSGEEIYNGKIIKVERWEVSLPNGKTAPREIVRHNGAAAIVPVDAAGNVTLVRQYRVAVGRFTWEIPAGKLDSPDEDPLDAAKRELKEETGYTAERWKYLGVYYPTVAYTNETIHMYLARGLTAGEQQLDEDEFLQYRLVPFRSVLQDVMDGKIEDGKTQLALLKAARYLGF